jgi:sec-independent protein translocase protein TatA
MFNISKEIIIVLVIVLIIFGPSQLPKLAKMFGKTMKSVRDGMDGTGADEDEDETPAKPKEMKAAAPEEVVAEKAEDEVPAPVKKKSAEEDAE